MTVKELRAALKGIKGDVEVLVHEYEMGNENPLRRIEGPMVAALPIDGTFHRTEQKQAIVLHAY